MNIRTPQQNKAYHALLQSIGLSKEEVAVLILQHTDGRTQRSSEMSVVEMNDLLSALTGISNSRRVRMRTKIVHIAKQIGCVKQVGSGWSYDGLNTWVKDRYGVATVFMLTDEQLPKAITGMEKWLDWERTKSVRELLAPAP